MSERRVLVASHYPPSTHPTAPDAVDLVVQLVGEGHHVEVLSPQPSAAHHSARLTGLTGVVSLLRFSRGFDQVVLCITPDVFLRANTNRIQWMKDAGALAFAIERGPATTLDIDDLRWFPVGGRISRRLWAAAERLVVHSDTDAARLHAEGAVPNEKIEVRYPGQRRAGAAAPQEWTDDNGASYLSTMEEIRRRAAAERRLAEAAAAPVVDESLAGVRSPLVTAASRLGRRVLGSYADPVFDAVKRRASS